MTCRDLENAWMSRLDGAVVATTEFDDHLVACAECRARVEGYRLLEHALSLPPARPEASREYLDRLTLELHQVQRTHRSSSRRRSIAWTAGLAAAAAIVAAVGLATWRISPDRGGRTPDESVLVARSAAELPNTLAQASSATLDFVRESSSPAARLGALVLQSTSFTRPDIAGVVDSTLPDSGGVLESVGSQVRGGIKPLTGSARKAFGFLLGPFDEAPPDAEPASRGA